METSSQDTKPVQACYRPGEVRDCPECGKHTIMGMPGGRDAVCKNCGYKDPCCGD